MRSRAFVTLPLPRLTRLLFPLAVLILLSSATPRLAAPASDPADGEVRALWVTRASLTSPEAIATAVRSARASGFNTLLVQVRGRGDAYYASALEPLPRELQGGSGAFDPLQTVLTAGRAQGMRVHAWLNVNLVSSSVTLPTAPGHLVNRHPDWLMVPRPLAVELARVSVRSPDYVARLAAWSRRQRADVEGLFSSPLNQEAASHFVEVGTDWATRYDVDGVHLDYIRFPGPTFDYSRSALTAFWEDVGPSLSQAERRRVDPGSIADLAALADRLPERWDGFRRSKLSALVTRLRTTVKARRPAAVFSAAVFPDPAEAAVHRFQDWRAWLEQGLIDVVCPMAYTSDASRFEAQIASAQEVAGPRSVWAGIGAYRLSSAETVRNIETARRLGARGVVLFSYDSLIQPPKGTDYLARVGRAAFEP